MTHQPPPPPPPPPQHPRLLLHDFISPQLCKELEFIHRSCAAAGYRPGVLSTTFPHLAATSSAHFLLPILPLRDSLRDLVEDTFACHFDLFVEFTALISWCKGASIGWHSDDNRSYLRQRDFAAPRTQKAVCYLNSHGKDFKGGIFHFRDGAPSSIVPAAGDVVIYTADDRNIHSVDEVLQFCYWKSNELESERRQTFGHEESVNQTIMKKTSELDLESLCNCKLANEILGGICDENAGGPFNWQDFSLGIARWKDYVSELHRQMLLLLPCWISNGALFYVNPSELQSSDE